MKTKLTSLLGGLLAICALSSCDIYGYPGAYGYNSPYAPRASYYGSSYSRPLFSYSSYGLGNGYYSRPSSYACNTGSYYSRPYSYGLNSGSYYSSPFSSFGGLGFNNFGFGGGNYYSSPMSFGRYSGFGSSGFGGLSFGGCQSFGGSHHHMY